METLGFGWEKGREISISEHASSPVQILLELGIETLVGGESGVEAAEGCVNGGGFLTKGKLLMGRRRDEGSGRVMELLHLLHHSFNFFFNFHRLSEIG